MKIEFLLRRAFAHGNRFACEGGLIDVETGDVEQDAVGGNFVSCFDLHDVSDDDVGDMDFAELTVAHDAHGDVVANFVERFEFFGALAFAEEPDEGCKSDSEKDSDRVDEACLGVVKGKLFDRGDGKGEGRCGEKNFDRRIVE